MDLSSLGGSAVGDVASFLQQPAENYGNDSTVEMHWAMKAFHHAEVYFNLISSVDTSILKLTKLDEELYTKFREQFPDLRIDKLEEDEMKSLEGKEKWRNFLNQFEQQVEDWNTGTLLRLDASQDVSETNSTLVPRIQFLAVEIARNREGYNAMHLKKATSKDSTDTPNTEAH